MTITAAGSGRPLTTTALTPLLCPLLRSFQPYSKGQRSGVSAARSAAQRAAHQERSACRAISSPSGPFSMRRSSRKR